MNPEQNMTREEKRHLHLSAWLHVKSFEDLHLPRVFQNAAASLQSTWTQEELMQTKMNLLSIMQTSKNHQLVWMIEHLNLVNVAILPAQKWCSPGKNVGSSCKPTEMP